MYKNYASLVMGRDTQLRKEKNSACSYFRTSLKGILVLAVVLLSNFSAFAQPSVLFTGLTSTTPSPTNFRFSLNTVGGFRQARFQANQSVGASTTGWAFHVGTPGAPNYSPSWRPLSGGNTLAINTYIPTTFANGAKYSAGGGGTDGLLPAITSGNYYTFNVSANASADNVMQLLETNFNPVTISSVTATTPSASNNAVLVTVTTSAAPSAGEFVYVRYSTNSYSSSTLVPITFNGTTGTAIIPNQALGAVSYYIYSSNKSFAAINTDVTGNGQGAHDMATLNLNNNGGSNYSYTQVAGTPTNFAGVYVVPSTSYATIAAFNTALTAGTVTGAVTCYVDASATAYTETATAGGISITKTGTVLNTITIKKQGSNAATITAFTPQVSGNINDAIFKIIGADYITIDGLTMQENSANTTTTTASNNMTEFGVALFYTSLTDGAQNNTIQNCTISLNRTNLNTFGIYSNTRHSATAVTTSAEVTAATGSNSNNKIYANSISNVNYGIVFIGAGTIIAAIDNGNDIGGASVLTGNTITNWGGGAAFSSYISLTGSNYCVFSNQQINDNIAFNTITSATLAQLVTTGGILKNYSVASPTTGTITTTINNNTVSVTNNPSAATTGGIVGINNQGLTPLLATATMSINNNTVQNCVLGGSTSTTNGITGITNSSVPGTMNMTGNNVINNAITATTATSGTNLGISNSGAANTVNLNSNIVRSLASTATSGQIQGIVNTGAVVNALNINNNALGNATSGFFSTSTATSGSLFGISTSGGAPTCALSIQTNDFRGMTYNVAASAAHTYIINSSATLSQNISSNTFTNLNVNTTGNIIFISNSVTVPATGTQTINSNSIVTAFNKTGAGGTITLCTSSASSAAGATITHNSNNFSNITVTGATTIAGWISTDGGTANKTYNGNTFNNWTGGSSSITAMSCSFGGGNGGNGNVLSNNTITNITGTGSIIGINLGISGTTHTANNNTITGLSSTGTGGAVTGIASSAPTGNIFSNTINSLSSTSTSSIVAGITSSGTTAQIFQNTINTLSCVGTTSGVTNGIMVTAGTTANVYKNKIYDLSTTGAFASTPGVNGIVLSGGTTVTAYNNLIGDLKATAAISTDAIRGISITSTTTSANYNIYYNTVHLTGTSSGANFGTSGIFHAASTTATTATLNLRNNIIVNNSTAVGTGTVTCFRRSAAATLGNYASTSNNNLFSSATGSIMNDGTTAFTLATFKAAVAPSRDAASVTETVSNTAGTFFQSFAGANAGFLHLVNGLSTQAESGAANIGTFTDDYDGQTRQGNAGYVGTGTAPDIGADEFTGSAPLPAIVLSANDIVAGSLTPGTNNSPIYSFAISSSVANANLTGLTITTTGSYLSADVTNLKVYYQATTPFVLGSATLLSTLTTPGVAGNKTFTSFTTATISSGTTGYIFITADIPCAALASNTIAVNAVTTANTTFAASSSLTGTTNVGNTQTITTLTLNNATAAGASVAGGSSSVSWTNPTGCFNEVLIVARTGSVNDGTPSGDGSAYTGNLAFGSGTALGSGFVVYKGSTSPQVVTGLTNGTQYFYKIFTRLGTTWSSGVEVSATPLIVYCTPASSAATTYISNVTTSGGVTNLNNTSVYTTGGYINYTAVTPTINQTPSSAVNFSVSIVGGTAGIAIFVDWNNNGLFTDAGETVYNSAAFISGPATGSFSVPGGQAVGNYRMRVVTDFNATSPSSCTFSGTRGEAEDYTFIVSAPVVPTITLADNTVTAANILQGSTNNRLYSFALSPTVANATLTGLTVTTNGTYISADVTNLKAWYQATSTFNAGTATLLSTLTTPGVGGLKTFPSFASQTIANGATGYIFITADTPCAAIVANTIAINAVNGTNTNFSSGTATGTLSAGNTQTIASAVPNNATAVSATTVSGTTVSVAWTAPTGCYNEVMIVAAPAANTGSPTGDGTAYTASLVYGSGTTLGNGFVVYKGTASPQTITALTSFTTYSFKIFTRLGTTWTSGVEVTGTPHPYCTAGLHSSNSNLVTNVTLTGTTLNSSNGVGTNGYQFISPTPASNTATVQSGFSYPVTLATTGSPTQVAIWVDFNASGIFESSEYFLLTLGTGTATGTIVVPGGATLGNVGLRMRARGATFTSSDACSAFASGETEDYIITIAAPPAPTITSLGSTSGCAGTSITINGTNLSGAVASNVTIGGTAVSSITSNNGSVLVAIIGTGTTGNVSVTTAGGTSTGPTFTVNLAPTTTWATATANLCTSTSIQTPTLSYSASTNSPVTYSITWNASPTNSFVGVTDASFAGTAGGGAINISVPSNTNAGTYTGTISVKNAAGCVSTGTQNFTVTLNQSPTGVTAIATPTALCAGGNIALTSGFTASSLAGAGMTAYTASRTIATSYTSIIPATPITTWRNGVSTDDNLSDNQPIGFSFNYNGTANTNFRVSTNGFITFNTSSSAIGSGTGAYGYSNSWTVASGGLMVAPNWDDLQTAGNLGTLADLNNSINYTTTGTTGSRVCTIEWFNMQDFATNSNASYNFQVKLYEIDNHIEFVYGTMTQSSNTPSISYSLGLSAATVSATPVAAELLSQTTSNTGAFGFTNQNSLATIPASNTTNSFALPQPVYSWTGPNSFTSSAANPTITSATTAVSGVYNLVVSNSVTSCASAQASSAAVTVNARPTASVGGTTSICSGGNTSINIAVTGSGTIIGTLNPGSIPFSGAAPTISVNVSPTSNTIYTVSSLSDANCLSVAGDLTGSATVTVSTPVDYANLQFPANGNICSTGSYTAYGQVYKAGVTEAAGQGSGITAELGFSSTNSNPSTWTNWIPATFNVQSGNNDEYQATLSALTAGTYYYAYRYQSGACGFQYGGYNVTGGGFWNGTTNVSGVLTVSAPSTAASISGTTSICTGASTNLVVNITGGTSPFTVVIANGPTVTNYVSGTNISVAPTSNTTYSITSVTSTGGCVGTANSGAAVVTVNPLPTVTAGNVSGCTGTSIALVGSPAGGTFSVANPYTGPSTAYTYSYTNANGCSATSASATITTNPLPTVTAGNVSGCAGTAIALVGSPAGGTFSVANPYTGPSTTYTYFYTDGNGCSAASASATITTNPLPTVTAGNVSGCAGTAIALVGSPAGGTFSVANPYTGPSTAYTYSYTNANGCSATSASATITTNPLPTITAGNVSGCAGTAIALVGSPAGGTFSVANPYTGPST
ncbi:GEVED domain-containing protein, partial [Flavobacterium sp.]|uniref:beta strand repeat-containing protein n=1 Tax=Flavobacterium sp. TaxID=239 RepID=UPI0025F11027